MKGCSYKNYLGGNGKNLGGDFNMAYPYKGPVIPNPHLAYTGQGGNLSAMYPNPGPQPSGFNFLNPSIIRGGSNTCPTCKMTGGKKDCGCSLFSGGSKHRKGCKCSICKTKTHSKNCQCSICKTKLHSKNCQCNLCLKGGVLKGGLLKGGLGVLKGGTTGLSNNGIPYANGLTGSAYNFNNNSLPGVNNIPGDANHYPLNTYPTDPQTSMQNMGGNKPFLGTPVKVGGGMNMGGGKKRKTRKQRGGTLSNFLGQDFINLGRQFTYNLGSAYNTINGYPTPANANPLPWQGQFSNSTPLKL
jgi:hypothetical protein